MTTSDELSKYPAVDPRLQETLLTSAKIYRRRFHEQLARHDIDELKARASAIRDRSTQQADELWAQASERLTEAGVDVIFAQDNRQALTHLQRLVGDQSLIVKSKSNLLVELGVGDVFGERLCETDTGDWIVQQMGASRMHPNAPALALKPAEVRDFLNERHGLQLDDSPPDIVRAINDLIREKIFAAPLGLTGANFVTADGQLIIVENEGNISLVTRVPPQHVAVVAYHRIVPSSEDAMVLCRRLAMFGTGQPATAYVNVISGPSYTTDIGKQYVPGAQGARKMHLIVVDNHRSEMLKQEKLRKALKCIGCGACMLHCPVSEIAGPQFGGVYQGGIGLVFSHHICRQKLDGAHGIYACMGCELCEEVCPVDAKIWDNIKTLRNANPSELSNQVVESLGENGVFSPTEHQ